MSETPTLPEALVAHMATREAARHNRAAEWYATLTDRERALVRDAAVMGYVQGTMHPKGDKHPKDSWVTAIVVQECLCFPDLYPAINDQEPDDDDE